MNYLPAVSLNCLMGRKSKRTKKQHYVPRFYLAGFSADGRHAYVFDKTNQREFLASIKDVAQEGNFYDYRPGTYMPETAPVPFDHQQVENMLAMIEARVAPFLRAFMSRAESGGITADDILNLAPYIAIQWMRTKEYRESLIALANVGTQALVDDLIKRNFPGESATVTLDPKCEAALHNEHFFNEQAILNVAKYLEDHLWIMGVNKTDHPLYTSDNPVVRRAHCFYGDIPLIGINDPGIEFAFPLDSRHLLLMLERRHFTAMKGNDLKCLELTLEQVADYNRLQVLKSYRHVYCESPDFDLARKVCRERPEVCKLDRKRVEVQMVEVEPLKSRMMIRVLD